MGVVKLFMDLPGIVQVLVTIPVLVYVFLKYHQYMEFKDRRRLQTKTALMSHTDTILRNILSRSIQNMRTIMIAVRGSAEALTQDDKTELMTCRSSASVALLVEAKENIKSFFSINGYIAKMKAGIDVSGIIHDRAVTLRDSCADIIDSVVRTSSPLYNNKECRFTTDEGITLYKSIVDQHYQEVLLEEAEINEWLKDTFGWFSKFLKYEH